VSVPDLRALNPSLDLDNLRAGQVIAVARESYDDYRATFDRTVVAVQEAKPPPPPPKPEGVPLVGGGTLSLGLGLLLGPTAGSVLYKFGGYMAPFFTMGNNSAQFI
jgi:hypothetical protein